jgi:1-phosphatidylinositol-3-phosphate 5-kinase
MFFEGCAAQHLGCTVLLRGATKVELSKLKRVVSRAVFTRYNWRLEKSFLMDEFALPPRPPTDSFFEEPVINDTSEDHPMILPPNKMKSYLETDSVTLLSSCEILHENCKNVAASPVLRGHVFVRDETESAKAEGVNSENVGNNMFDPAVCVLSHDTGEVNARNEGIKSWSKNDVLLPSDMHLSKSVQSENSSGVDKMKHACHNKVQYVSPSHCASCRKTLQHGIRKQIDEVSENLNVMNSLSSACESDICVHEPADQLMKGRKNAYCDTSRTQVVRIGSKDKSTSEEKRMNVESVRDFSDPLHVYLNLEDEVFSAGHQSTPSGQCLSVAELPLTNRFRKSLDDTILSFSPYLKVGFLFSLN